MTYRPHLDGIRAIAVLAVVLYHAHVPGFPGGFVGVDVFFVISGYLITGLLLREFEETGDVSIRRFVERRVRRLAPALFVVLLATLVAGMVWLSPIGGEQQGLAKSAIATVLLSANFYFWRHTGGYFDAPTDSFPLLHTWTLSVEEQFYLLWPWLLLAAGTWARWRGAVPARAALVLLAAVFALSLAACVWFTRSHPQAAFFLMPFRAWEFAAGGAAFLLLRRRRPVNYASESIAWLGFVAVIASVAVFDDETAFPGWIALVPVLGSAALIYGTEANAQGLAARLLSLRPMVFVGLISYSLYLWHWPMLSIARTASLDEEDLGQSLALCAAAVMLAWLTYRYIEQPIRSQHVLLMATRRRTFRIGATMMVCLMVVALGLGVWAKSIWPRLPGNADKAARIAAIRKPDWDCKATAQVRAADGTERGCMVGHGGPVRVLLWGDSHAGHLKSVLEALAASRGVTGLLRYAPSCPPAIDFAVQARYSDIRNCVLFNRDVLADIRARTTLNTVILSARWVDYVDRKDRVPLLTAALKRTVAALRTTGVRIVLVAPGVDFPYRVPACLVRRDEAFCNRSRTEAQRRRETAMSVIRSVVLSFPETVVVDPLDSLCTNNLCPVLHNDDVLYSDWHHLSLAGSKQLIPAFLAVQRHMMQKTGSHRLPDVDQVLAPRKMIEAPSD